MVYLNAQAVGTGAGHLFCFSAALHDSFSCVSVLWRSVDHVHGVVWFILNILIEATLTAFCAAKRKISTTAENIVSQFLPLLSLLYIGMTGAVIREVNAFLLILHAMICFVCCFVVSFIQKRTGFQGGMCRIQQHTAVPSVGGIFLCDDIWSDQTGQYCQSSHVPQSILYGSCH